MSDNERCVHPSHIRVCTMNARPIALYLDLTSLLTPEDLVHLKSSTPKECKNECVQEGRLTGGRILFTSDAKEGIEALQDCAQAQPGDSAWRWGHGGWCTCIKTGARSSLGLMDYFGCTYARSHWSSFFNSGTHDHIVPRSCLSIKGIHTFYIMF